MCVRVCVCVFVQSIRVSVSLPVLLRLLVSRGRSFCQGGAGGWSSPRAHLSTQTHRQLASLPPSGSIPSTVLREPDGAT